MIEALRKTKSYVTMIRAIAVLFVEIARTDFTTEGSVCLFNKIIAGAGTHREPVIDVCDRVMQTFHAKKSENSFREQTIVLTEAMHRFGVFGAVIFAIDTINAQSKFIVVPFFRTLQIRSKKQRLAVAPCKCQTGSRADVPWCIGCRCRRGRLTKTRCR